jgi:hypothetical protein
MKLRLSARLDLPTAEPTGWPPWRFGGCEVERHNTNSI